MKLKESWRFYSDDQVRAFLRTGVEGKDHPSRRKTLELLAGMTSVLDVGCGTGVLYELIREHHLPIEYLGLDVTERFVEEARRRFPEDQARFQQGSLFDLNGLGRRFDAVVARHVLEHLPDYVPAVQRLYEHAGQKLIIVFYLPPKPLRFRRKVDERLERGFYTHTYDSGRWLDHLLNELTPRPSEIRIHPRQGSSDPTFKWGDRENVIYEVFPPSPDRSGSGA
jgi:SAM-dependent methyltransferase